MNEKRDLETGLKEKHQSNDRLDFELNLSQKELKELREGNKSLDITKFTPEKSLTEQMMLI